MAVTRESLRGTSLIAGGSKRCLKVNASAVGPLLGQETEARKASSGGRERARRDPPQDDARSAIALEPLKSAGEVVLVMRPVNELEQRRRSSSQTVRLMMNSGFSLSLMSVAFPLSDLRRHTKPGLAFAEAVDLLEAVHEVVHTARHRRHRACDVELGEVVVGHVARLYGREQEESHVASLDDQLANQIANIEKATGRSFADWIALINASGIQKHSEIIAMLKKEHDMTYGNANLLAIKAREAAAGGAVSDADRGGKPLRRQERSHLRPLYDAVVAEDRRLRIRY